MNKMFLLSIFTIFLTTHGVQAHDKRQEFNVDEAIRTSDMIFLGSVVDVKYAISQGGSPRLESLPHTFVTYQIQRLIKGNPRQAQEKLTLRFLGGRGQEAEFLFPANYPLFDLKDVDVLFIKGNTVNACPLINCASSRMRLLSERVFNERGQQVVQTPRDQTAFGKFEQREEILTHQVSQTTIKAVLSKQESEGPPEAELPIGKQFDAQTFVNYIEAKVKRLYPPDVMAQLPLVPTADVEKPFAVRPLANLRPKVVRPLPYRPIQPPSATDLDEEKAFLNNKQNPVIVQ